MSITTEHDDRARMRAEISCMEATNSNRREKQTLATIQPPWRVLLPTLPRPEYAIHARSVGHSDEELDFYVACEKGRLDEVIAYIQGHQPFHAVRQYGLEQASFGNQPMVARYLLQHDAELHCNVFERGDSKAKGFLADTSIFRKFDQEGWTQAGSLIPLLQAFIEAGWRPNQPWPKPSSESLSLPFTFAACTCNKQLALFLIDQGADPLLKPGESERTASGDEGNRGALFNKAVKGWDVELLDLLISHGADPKLGSPLHLVVQPMFRGQPLHRGAPFSQRRATAEYILEHGVGVDDITSLPSRDLYGTPFRMPPQEETALTLASAGEDWEFVEWLLEKGADPELLDGKALRTQWWQAPYFGPNNPEVVRELMEKVKIRQKESAAG